MRDRQHLGCLRVRDRVITLERMYFADEVRAADEHAPSGTRVEKRELEMATELIDRFTRLVEPEEVQGHLSRDALQDHQAEAQGQRGARRDEPEPEEALDLMDALRASLEAAGGARAGQSGPRAEARTRLADEGQDGAEAPHASAAALLSAPAGCGATL